MTSIVIDIKCGTHNTIYIIHHTYLFFSFQICTYQTCTHIIVYIIYCVFAILYIAYLYIILLLSVSCPVAVILLHCGASVTRTNSSYKHTWPIKRILIHSDSSQLASKWFLVDVWNQIPSSSHRCPWIITTGIIIFTMSIFHQVWQPESG